MWERRSEDFFFFKKKIPQKIFETSDRLSKLWLCPEDSKKKKMGTPLFVAIISEVNCFYAVQVADFLSIV